MTTSRLLRAVPVLLILALIGLVDPPTAVAASDNDNIADASDLGNTFSTGDTGPMIGNTAETDEPAHAGNVATQSVWSKWTAPFDTGVTVESCHPSAAFDSVLAVYFGPALNPTMTSISPIAANDDACGQQSIVKFQATGGSTYYIALDKKGFAGSTTFSVVLRAAPVNDDFSGELLTGEPITRVGSNVGASKEGSEPNHAGDAGGASVWWSWQAPATTQYTIQTCGSGFNTLLGVYTGGGFSGGVTEVASNDDHVDCFQQSKVLLSATAGTMYRIAVDGKQELGSQPATGNIQLDIAEGTVVTPDTTDPDTSIASLVKNRKPRRLRRTVTVEFTGSDNRSGGITYECRVDNDAFSDCTSPFTSRKVRRKRKHTVQVRAVDAAGNVDDTPATSAVFRFR